MLWNLLIFLSFLIILLSTPYSLGGVIYVCMIVSVFLIIRDFIKGKVY